MDKEKAIAESILNTYLSVSNIMSKQKTWKEVYKDNFNNQKMSIRKAKKKAKKQSIKLNYVFKAIALGILAAGNTRINSIRSQNKG